MSLLLLLLLLLLLSLLLVIIDEETPDYIKNLSIIKVVKDKDIDVSIHPAIDSALNRNYHFDYSSHFVRSLFDPWINASIKTLFEMSGAPKGKPLMCSVDENNRTSREIVEKHLVDQAITASVNKNKNLVLCLREVMIASGLAEDKVEATLSNFDPAVSINEQQTRSQNLHVIKAQAFHNYPAFKAFVDENREKKKGIPWEIVLSPRVLAANIKANDSLHSDVARETYLKHLKKWVSLAEGEGRSRDEDEASSTDDEDEAKTLLTIRQNVLKNATLRLASEQAIHTVSLADYSDGEDFSKRTFAKPTTAQFLKLVASSKPFEIDMAKPEKSDVPLAYHCGHCPAMATPKVSANNNKNNNNKKRKTRHDGDNNDNDNDDDDDDDHNQEPARKKLVFVSPVLANFNVLKAIPMDSLQDFLRHYALVHRVGDPNSSVAAKIGAHHYCILCRFCDFRSLRNAFVCCLGRENEKIKKDTCFSFFISIHFLVRYCSCIVSYR